MFNPSAETTWCQKQSTSSKAVDSVDDEATTRPVWANENNENVDHQHNDDDDDNRENLIASSSSQQRRIGDSSTDILSRDMSSLVIGAATTKVTDTTNTNTAITTPAKCLGVYPTTTTATEPSAASETVCHADGDGAAASASATLDINFLLIKAAYLQRKEVVEECLRRNPVLTYQDPSGRTALHFAAASGCPEIAKAILDHLAVTVPDATERKAIVDFKDPKGWTPLHIAVCRKFPKILELLLRIGADPMIELRHNCLPCRVGRVESSAIHFAAIKSDVEILLMLLSRGISVNTADEHRRTALHYAACRKDSAVVKVLLDRGAFASAVDIHNRTPLHAAALGGHQANAELLLAAEADVSVKDTWDMTAGALAATCGFPDMANLLHRFNKLTSGDRATTAAPGALSMVLLTNHADHDLKTTAPAGIASAAGGGSGGTLQMLCSVEGQMTPLDKAAAAAIICGLKEPKVAQVCRAVLRLGADRCLRFYEQTMAIQASGGLDIAPSASSLSGGTPVDGGGQQTKKSPGGVFFTLMKNELQAAEKMDDWRYIRQEDKERLKADSLKKRAIRRAKGLERAAAAAGENANHATTGITGPVGGTAASARMVQVGQDEQRAAGGGRWGGQRGRRQQGGRGGRGGRGGNIHHPHGAPRDGRMERRTAGPYGDHQSIPWSTTTRNDDDWRQYYAAQGCHSDIVVQPHLPHHHYHDQFGRDDRYHKRQLDVQQMFRSVGPNGYPLAPPDGGGIRELSSSSSVMMSPVMVDRSTGQTTLSGANPRGSRGGRRFDKNRPRHAVHPDGHEQQQGGTMAAPFGGNEARGRQGGISWNHHHHRPPYDHYGDTSRSGYAGWRGDTDAATTTRGTVSQRQIHHQSPGGGQHLRRFQHHYDLPPGAEDFGC